MIMNQKYTESYYIITFVLFHLNSIVYHSFIFQSMQRNLLFIIMLNNNYVPLFSIYF